MSFSVEGPGLHDLYKDGAFLKVGVEGTISTKPVPTANDPRTSEFNQSGKVTLDVSALPWDQTPKIASVASVGGANNTGTRAAAFAAKAVKLRKDANSDNFYFTTG